MLGSPGRPRRVRVLLDGRPLPDRLAGPTCTAASRGWARSASTALVDLGRVERHVVTVVPEPGVAGYAFTFG